MLHRTESAATTPWNADRNLWLSEEELHAIGTAALHRRTPDFTSPWSGSPPQRLSLLRFTLEPDGQACSSKMDLAGWSHLCCTTTYYIRQRFGKRKGESFHLTSPAAG